MWILGMVGFVFAEANLRTLGGWLGAMATIAREPALALGQHLGVAEVSYHPEAVDVFEQIGSLEMSVTPVQLAALEQRP
jgi:hypothetical protein